MNARFLTDRLAFSKLPLIRQYDQADCGPAALLSVLKFWGGDDSLVHVRELARTDSRGSTMLSLINAAEELGFRAKGAAGEYEDLMREEMPCIAHVVLESGLQHFVVVYRVDAKKILLADPGAGRRTMSRHDFVQIWRRKAVVLLTPTSRLHDSAPAHWFKWIFSYFQREEAWLHQSVFLGVVYTALGLLTAVFVQLLLDRFIPDANYSMIVTTGVALIVLQLLRACAGYLRQRFMVELNKRVNIRVNEDFLAHIFHLPLRFFDTRKTGDITSRIQDTIKIQRGLLLIFGTTVIDIFVIVGSLTLMFILAPELGWLALAATPVYGAVVFHVTRRIKVEQRETMQGYARVEASYIDNLDGIDEILGFRTSSAFAKLNTLLYRSFQDKTERLGLTRARISAYAELAGGVLIMASLIFGALLVIRDRLMLGQMMAAYSLLGSMIPSTNRLVEANIALQGASVAASRLMDLLLIEPEESTGIRPFEMTDAVRVTHGRFHWPRGTVLFDDINVSIPIGRLTGLWGPSGSGKSTLVKILERKYSLSGGTLLVDSVPSEEFELEDYRTNIAVVPETVKIFTGTIADNILIGRNVGAHDELLQRVERSGLQSVLDRFDKGLLTRVGEENRRLSAGERQIVGLMRALFDQPKVLIVDEGISAVDVHIAKLVFTTLRQYARDHAVLLISHDLAALRRTDHLYVLEEGAVAQSGAPEALVEQAGRFEQLWELQQPHSSVHA